MEQRETVILPYPVEYYYTRPPPVPESHFFELILLDSLHYMIGQLFPTYQSGAKLTCVIIVILRQVPALSPCREAEFRRLRSVILFRGLSRPI